MMPSKNPKSPIIVRKHPFYKSQKDDLRRSSTDFTKETMYEPEPVDKNQNNDSLPQSIDTNYNSQHFHRLEAQLLNKMAYDSENYEENGQKNEIKEY